MNLSISLVVAPLSISLTFAQVTQRPHDPDEGTLSSIKPRIPEPMVVDLIRPLGAKRGEFEVNSLFRLNPTQRPRQLQWAPEVEYAFWDGYGVEFEVPSENARIANWKGALQGTLPGPHPTKFIHGWQAIGEVARGREVAQIDMLYLAGARWHRHWSAFSMTGLRRELHDTSGSAFLGNYSLFFHQRDSVTYGLESNFKSRGVSGPTRLFMPQVQLRGNRLNLQFGAGWLSTSRAHALQIGWRLSREF